MSWKRCSGFFTVTPMYCWARGQGLGNAEAAGKGRDVSVQSGAWRRGGGAGRATAHAQALFPCCCSKPRPTHRLHTPFARTAAPIASPPEGVVEVEQPLLGLDPQERSHVLKVGQRGRQAHQADHLLGGLRGARGGEGGRRRIQQEVRRSCHSATAGAQLTAAHSEINCPHPVHTLPRPQAPPHERAHLNLAHGARHDGLEHRASVVVQQVDFVDDDQPHQLGVGAVACGRGGGRAECIVREGGEGGGGGARAAAWPRHEQSHLRQSHMPHTHTVPCAAHACSSRCRAAPPLPAPRSPPTALARDDVPLLGRDDDDLRLVNLLLRHGHVASELAHLREAGEGREEETRGGW